MLFMGKLYHLVLSHSELENPSVNGGFDAKIICNGPFSGEVAVNSSDLGTGWRMVVRQLIARPLNRDTPTNIEYGKICGYMGIPTGDGDLWYGFRIETLKRGFHGNKYPLVI